MAQIILNNLVFRNVPLIPIILWVPDFIFIKSYVGQQDIKYAQAFHILWSCLSVTNFIEHIPFSMKEVYSLF